jgi:hypothetical protein
MNETEHLLTVLSEECAEVSQRVSKALRFGLAEVQPGQTMTNAERIVEEIVDFHASVQMLIRAGAIRIDDEEFMAAQRRKVEKVERFMEYARSQGAITEPHPSVSKGKGEEGV